MRAGEEFFNLYNHDFIRVTVAIPGVRVAYPAFNAKQTIAFMQEAARTQSVLALFPELGISGYSCDDLFHQDGRQPARQPLAKTFLALNR